MSSRGWKYIILFIFLKQQIFFQSIGSRQAHKILVSAPVPLELIGFDRVGTGPWGLGSKGSGTGLDNEWSPSLIMNIKDNFDWMHDDTNTSLLVPGLINMARPVLQLTPASGGWRPLSDRPGPQSSHNRVDTNLLIVNCENGWSWRNVGKMTLCCLCHSFFK